MPNSNAKVFAPVSLGTLAGVKQLRETITLAQIQALGATSTGTVSLGQSINAGGYVITASVVNNGTVAGGGGVTGVTAQIGDGTGTITSQSGSIFAAGQPQAMLPTNEAVAGTLEVTLVATGGNLGDMTGPDTGLDITVLYAEG